MTTRVRRRRNRDRRADETTPAQRTVYAEAADVMRERLRRAVGDDPRMTDAAFGRALERDRAAAGAWLVGWRAERGGVDA